MDEDPEAPRGQLTCCQPRSQQVASGLVLFTSILHCPSTFSMQLDIYVKLKLQKPCSLFFPLFGERNIPVFKWFMLKWNKTISMVLFGLAGDSS